jgi:hypothetical protein
MGQPHDGDDVDPDLALLAVDGEVGEVAVGPEPGVVDEEVDGAAGVGEAGLDGGQLVRVGEVGAQHLDPHGGARLGDLGGQLLEPLGVTSDDDQVSAFFRQLQGDGAANSR